MRLKRVTRLNAIKGILVSLLLPARRFRAFVAHLLRGWTFVIALSFVAAGATLLSGGFNVAGIGVTLTALPALWLKRWARAPTGLCQDGVCPQPLQ